MNSEIKKQIKLSFYAFWFLEGILLYMCDFNYSCNKPGKECFMCGTRKAFGYIFQLDFVNAYHSNKLSILLFILSMIFVFDIIRMILLKIKGREW